MQILLLLCKWPIRVERTESEWILSTTFDLNKTIEFIQRINCIKKDKDKIGRLECLSVS